MTNKKSELTDKQKVELVEGIISQVIDIYTNNFAEIFGEDAETAFTMGGCEALAQMLKELFPEGEVLYSSHHAVFNICGVNFDIRGANPDGDFTNNGSAGFYPVSEWTKREFAPIIEYSLVRIRQSWPYFWDNTDKFDKTSHTEVGQFTTYEQFCKAGQNRLTLN